MSLLALQPSDLTSFSPLDWVLVGIAVLLVVVAVVTPFALLNSLWELRLQAQRNNEFIKALAVEAGKMRHDAQAAAQAATAIVAELRTNRELFEKNAGKILVFLHNLDAESDYTNKLLEWMGKQRETGAAAPAREDE